MFPKKKWLQPRKKNKSEKQRLYGILDRWFSKFIRLRDADEHGVCRCITCGTFHFWNKDIHAGHYVQRNRVATRWDEKNVNAQCCQCNTFNEGRQDEHGKAIDRKYGKGTAEYLMIIGMARGSKVSEEWLKIKIKEYKEKVKKLIKNIDYY